MSIDRNDVRAVLDRGLEQLESMNPPPRGMTAEARGWGESALLYRSGVAAAVEYAVSIDDLSPHPAVADALSELERAVIVLHRQVERLTASRAHITQQRDALVSAECERTGSSRSSVIARADSRNNVAAQVPTSGS